MGWRICAPSEDAAAETQALWPDREIAVTVEEPLLSHVDADRIRQVLGNLLSNAVKYGEPGTQIGVCVRRRSDDQAEIVVTNRGAGIPEDQLAHVFSRFARTREAEEGDQPGLGLGLYISQGLVEAHGGRIWVESEPDEETSFHVILPALPPEQVTITKAAA